MVATRHLRPLEQRSPETEHPVFAGFPAMEPGGLEPPTSWGDTVARALLGHPTVTDCFD
jgi:hypothetical protein